MADSNLPAPDSEEKALATAVGGEVLAGYDPLQLAESLRATVGLTDLARATSRVGRELVGVVLGKPFEPNPKDFRFQDPAWHDNPVYRRLAQAYLIWAQEMMSLVEEDRDDWRTAERSRFAMAMITSALAPSNTPVNPAAIKRLFETAGASGVRGVRNLARDLVKNRGLPAQVDKRAFTVGVDVAATPGAVVHRDPMFEILEYTPVTETVLEVPLLLLPPPVNKYYFWDLAPGRSMIEYCVAQGIRVFTMAWRDPRPGMGTLGIDDYVSAQIRAVDVAREICSTDTVNVFGDCSGGLFETLMLGHLASKGDDRIGCATFGVTVLDFSHPSGVGMTASNRTLAGSKRKAERGAVISANDISSTFVWMRPDDLVWRYAINNWLLGNDPPAFDVLFWNNDGQGLSSRLAYDLGLVALENTTARNGTASVLGEVVELDAIKCDSYFIAGRTDHISPWQACYAGTRLFGGHAEFVLASSGHVQAIINPPGNPKASYYTGGTLSDDADEWLASAEKHSGSWWPAWTTWLKERSGSSRPAPESLGSAQHPTLEPAPGSYVLGK
jgi:polyhydroxyalkanoate synthase subunit PhaC